MRQARLRQKKVFPKRRWFHKGNDLYLAELVFDGCLALCNIGTGDLDVLEQDLFLSSPFSWACKGILTRRCTEKQELAEPGDESVVKIGLLQTSLA